MFNLFIFAVISSVGLWAHAESNCPNMPSDLTGIYESKCVGQDVDSAGKVLSEYEHNLFEIRQAPQNSCMIAIDTWSFGSSLPFAVVNGEVKHHHFNNEDILITANFIVEKNELKVSEAVKRGEKLKLRTRSIIFEDGKPKYYSYKQDTFGSEVYFLYKCEILEKRPMGN